MAMAGLAQEAKTRPILFSGPMVRAILEGQKTQTRRVVKPQPWDSACGGLGMRPIWGQGRPRSLGGDVYAIHARFGSEDKWLPSPYGGPGDRLWVREGWRWYGRIRQPGEVEGGFEYRADGAQRKFTDFTDPAEAWEQFKAAAINEAYHWRPSIHMPRWASRITLELTDVRVERLQDVTEEDARAEGVDYMPSMPAALTHRTSFGKGWDKLNGGRGFGWDVNPWVWVLTFRRLTPDARA